MKEDTYWFSLLTDSEKDEWIKELKNANCSTTIMLNNESKDFLQFINSYFSWTRSIKGFKYWQTVAHSNRKFSNYSGYSITFNNNINEITCKSILVQ